VSVRVPAVRRRRAAELGELNDSLADDFHRWRPGFTYVPDRQVLAA
jgi:hypothetical protein